MSNPANFNDTLPAATAGKTNVNFQLDPTTGNVSACIATSTLVLETNGAVNPNQTLLNLVAGTNITLSVAGGTVTINGAASQLPAVVPASNVLLQNQTAPITFTNFPLPTFVAGQLYRVSMAAMTTVAGTAGTLSLTIGRMGADQSTVNVNLTEVGDTHSIVQIYEGGNGSPILNTLRYQTFTTGATGAYAYDLFIVLERIK